MCWPVLQANAQESRNNLPLPRWAALSSKEVNLRLGPGERYPIDWVIKERGLPVEIQKEFENWRQIKLQDGTVGWVHRIMLSGSRNAMIVADKQLLYRQPTSTSPVQARLEKNVLVKIDKCLKTWCFLEVQGFEGWAPKQALWGVYPHEVWK